MKKAPWITGPGEIASDLYGLHSIGSRVFQVTQQVSSAALPQRSPAAILSVASWRPRARSDGVVALIVTARLRGATSGSLFMCRKRFMV